MSDYNTGPQWALLPSERLEKIFSFIPHLLLADIGLVCCSWRVARRVAMLLSGSEDGALRLLSLQTWTCLVTYKGHVFPVCVVKLSPLGYYFATCGNDRGTRGSTESNCK
jgi:WD40 repeat protein